MFDLALNKINQNALKNVFISDVFSGLVITKLKMNIIKAFGLLAIVSGKLITDRSELSCCDFSKLSNCLERILMEDIDTKNSSNTKLQIYAICSIRFRSRI